MDLQSSPVLSRSLRQPSRGNMDPNANLREQRDLLKLIETAVAGGSSPRDLGWEMRRVLELTEAMDMWLSNGGFLPEAWAR